MGFTLRQVGIAAQLTGVEGLAKILFAQFDETQFPYTLEHGRYHKGANAPAGKQAFAFALDLLLDGLERLRDERETETPV